MIEQLSNNIFTYGFQISLILSAVYLTFKFLFKKSIIVWSDPLNIGFIFASFAFTGYLLLPFISSIGTSYWIILFLFIVYFLAASKAKVKVNEIEKTLNINTRVQILFSLILLSLLVIILLDDLRSGNIPILRENGLNTRFEGIQNRFLFMIYFSISGIPLILLCFSEVKAVKKISFLTIILIFIKNIFLASKSSLFFIPLQLINYHFLLSYKASGKQLTKGKNDADNNFEAIIRLKSLLSSIKSLKNKIFVSIGFLFSISLLLLPVYMNIISASSNNAFVVIFSRLFAGYDSLIFAASDNIPMRAHMLDYGMPIWLLYFQPILKILFGFKPAFNSVPELLLHKVFGIDQQLLATRPIPNSNIILESVWTSGIFFGTLLIISFAFTSFFLRKVFLQKSSFLLIDIIFFNFFVMYPLGWFTEGFMYFNYIVYSLTIYFPFVLLVNLASSRFYRDLHFRII